MNTLEEELDQNGYPSEEPKKKGTRKKATNDGADKKPRATRKKVVKDENSLLDDGEEEPKPKAASRKRAPKAAEDGEDKKPKVARKRTIKNENLDENEDDEPKPKTSRKRAPIENEESKPKVSRKKAVKNDEAHDDDDEYEEKPKKLSRKDALIKEDTRLNVSRDVFDGDASFFQKPWKEHELLSEMQNIELETAKNIIRLFQEENTIPFICRYRRELIGDMSPDELRDVKISYNQILNVHAKAEVVLNHLDKDQKLTDEMKHDILCARTIDEIDHLYAPYKPASKGSLADRAKALGLDNYAEDLLMGISPMIDIPALVKPEVEGLETKHKVEDGIQHFLAFKFSKNTLVLEELRRL